MKYTRVKKSPAMVMGSNMSVAECRFNAKKLRNFALTVSDLQGSGTNSIEKQTAKVANGSTNVGTDNLNLFRDNLITKKIDKSIVQKEKSKDKRKIRPPVMPVALKHSITAEENKNNVSPLI